ncbi:MAG: type II secretion system protein [Nitrospiraceae bacterium]|nr:type II secretion system protein [Nitrospiraceae bacterium]
MRKDSRGFTLLEIMIALAIVGGLLITLLYSLNYHLGVAERHETLTVATMLAKNKLYDIEASPIADKGDFPAPYSAYRFTVAVTPSPYPGISEVLVTVANGKESVKLAEYVQKKGI